MTFKDVGNDGLITTADIDPMKVNNYYPFGLNMEGNWSGGAQNPNKYQFNGKELNQDFGLDWNDYGARFYDAALARWTAVDPLAGKYDAWSPYNYTMNNPIKYIDPTGKSTESTIVTDNGGGTYTVTGGDPNDNDKGVYVDDGKGGKGTKIGESLTSHSFFYENNEAVVGAVIDMNSREGQTFIDNQIVRPDIGVIDYTSNAKGGEPLDIKTQNIDQREPGMTREQYMYRGSVTNSGKIGSARDFGNIGAGIVSGRNGLSWSQHRLGADGLQTWQQLSWTHLSWAEEGVPTQLAQKIGYKLGVKLRGLDSYYGTFRPFQNNTIEHADF